MDTETKPQGSLWFFPTRDNQWEVYCYLGADDPEHFVGVRPTRGEADKLAARFAQDNGIRYDPVPSL